MVIDRFLGSSHKVAKHLIKLPNASYALDADLSDYSLKAFNTNAPIDSDIPHPNDGDTKWIRIGCCWLNVPFCFEYTDGAVACDEYFVTGNSAYPERLVINRETCDYQFRRLGLPCPDSQLTVDVIEDDTDKDDTCFTVTGSTLTKDSEGRVYAYQYVNAYNEYSAISQPSEVVLLNEGATVTVSGWKPIDDSWGATHVRILRSVSGFKMDDNTTNKAFDTAFMVVDTIPITQAYYIDSKRNYELIESVLVESVLPPPTTLKGISRIPGTNTLVGYSGSSIFMTHNNDFSNWNIELELDDTVCAIGVTAGFIYVATPTVPYVIEVSRDCEHADCLKVLKHTEFYPYAGCGTQGHTIIGNGFAYVSHDGIIYLQGTNTPVVLTESIYSVEEWRRMLPNSGILLYKNGMLYAFFANDAFVTNVNMKDGLLHSKLSDKGVLWGFMDEQGSLFIGTREDTYSLFGGRKKRTFTWVSPEIRTDDNKPFGFSYARVDSKNGGAWITVFCEDRIVLTRPVSRHSMTLPLWGIGYTYRVELRGSGAIYSVALDNIA